MWNEVGESNNKVSLNENGLLANSLARNLSEPLINLLRYIHNVLSVTKPETQCDELF